MDRPDNVHVLAEKITGITTAMLITRARDGRLKARPMMVVDRPFDGTLWFFTRLGAEKIEEIAIDDGVCVTFADSATDRYVSATGRASIVNDRERMRDLWQPGLAPWLEHGPEDPVLRLVRVDVDRAELWEPPDAHLEFVGFAKSPAAALAQVRVGNSTRQATSGPAIAPTT